MPVVVGAMIVALPNLGIKVKEKLELERKV